MKSYDKVHELIEKTKCEFSFSVADKYTCSQLWSLPYLMEAKQAVKEESLQYLLFDDYCNWRDKQECPIRAWATADSVYTQERE